MAALLGCNMVYYPFFTCFLLTVAAAMALWRRDRAHATMGGVLIAVITGVLLINVLPNILYTRAHGATTSGKRYSYEVELSGLKITQLLLPVTGHRVPALARLKANYNATHPLINENDWASLGLIAGTGFLVLIGWSLFVRRRHTPATAADGAGTLVEHLSVFNLATLLLATLGGFSVLFAVLVTPQIRAYNRTCVFIAFFSLLTVAVGLDLAALRWVRSRLGAFVFYAALTLLGVLGLLDQTGADADRDWTGLKHLYRNDQRFFAQVQETLPPGSEVFELPYEPFPEYGLTINGMVEYSEFRPYVHTHGLRWSYGTMKGLPGDAWERDTAALPPEGMLTALRHAGFSAIYIDRSGYADHAAALETRLRALLDSPPMADPMGRFLVFKLPAPTGPALPLSSILPPLPPVWTGGFYDLETAADKSTSWRWCAADGELRFSNDSGGSRRVRLDAVLRAGVAPAGLQIRGGNLVRQDLTITPAGTPFTCVLDLPPGDSVMTFHCDANPLPNSNGDLRTLVWRVDNFAMSNADES